MVYKIHVRVSVCLRACQSPTTICSCVNRVAPKALDSYLSPQFIFVFVFFPHYCKSGFVFVTQATREALIERDNTFEIMWTVFWRRRRRGGKTTTNRNRSKRFTQPRQGAMHIGLTSFISIKLIVWINIINIYTTAT